MTKIQRIRAFLAGLIMIITAGVMIFFPEIGYQLVIIFLSISLLLYGIRQLSYYFSMARFMVGGKTCLYKGVILFDLGMFTLMLAKVPNTYIMLYLIAVNLFSGGVDIVSAIDSKRSGAGHWRLKLAGGIVSVFIAICCVIFGRDPVMVVYIYCSGLIYSAVFKIISAFRRSAIIYTE